MLTAETRATELPRVRGDLEELVSGTNEAPEWVELRDDAKRELEALAAYE